MTDGLHKIKVVLEISHLDEVIGLAMSLGAQGVEVCDSETHGLPIGCAWVHAWHGSSQTAGALLDAYRLALDPGQEVSLTHEGLDWREDLKPVEPRPLGATFIISEDGVAEGARTPISVSTGLGFGDGLHPTTQCCADLLEAAMTSSPMDRVLDFGTGTGVLAMMAALLGARRVVATDIDSVARDGAYANIRRNGLEERIVVAETAPRDLEADLVIANLYLGVLPGLIPTLSEMTATDGVCILSGFTQAGAPSIEHLMRDHGFEVCDRVARSGWVALGFERTTE